MNEFEKLLDDSLLAMESWTENHHSLLWEDQGGKKKLAGILSTSHQTKQQHFTQSELDVSLTYSDVLSELVAEQEGEKTDGLHILDLKLRQKKRDMMQN